MKVLNWHAGGVQKDALDVLTRMPGAERFVRFLTEHPDATRREHRGAHLTASALVVDATAGRVLLCLHRRVGKWLQLGGHIEDGDLTLAGAAFREATEESGIDGLLISAEPIGLDVHAVRCSGGDSLHWDVRYAALAPPGAVERVSAESSALGWFTPDALPDPLGDAVESLIEPALAWARGRLAGAESN
jgi:8-oxo-dGTP pyrophosphatase MutT (NUDIX family)